MPQPPRVVINVDAMDFKSGKEKTVIVDVTGDFDVGEFLLASSTFMKEWLKKQKSVSDVRIT